jgi:(p)ppGpp synthase/HD superfamily hydrolase
MIKRKRAIALLSSAIIFTNSTSGAVNELKIFAEDGIGVIAAISMALAEMKVSITQINTQKQKNGDLMIVNLSIGCKNTSHYDSIVSKLRQLPCVVSVSRGFSH